jgi:hypothetical protein
MDPWIAKLLTVTYPTLLVCGTALLAWWMKLRHERHMLDRAPSGQLERLEQAIEALREEHAVQIAELHERVDFAERLLAQGKMVQQEEKIITPV